MSNTSEQGAALAGRRRAADGSEIGGGRKDAPSGWGEGTTASIGRRPALEAADRSAAVRVGADDADDEGHIRRRGAGGGEGAIDEAMVGEDAYADDSDECSSSAPPAAPGARKIQALADLADQEEGSGAAVGGGLSRGTAAVMGPSGSSAGVNALSGIDLSLLTAVIAPPEALEEPDEPWQFDRVLQQISQVRMQDQTMGAEVKIHETSIPRATIHTLLMLFPRLQEMAAEQERREAEEAAAR